MNLHLIITSSHPASVRLAPNTRAVLSDCKLRGGDFYRTVGLLCDRASLSLNNCTFSYHKLAGNSLLLSWGYIRILLFLLNLQIDISFSWKISKTTKTRFLKVELPINKYLCKFVSMDIYQPAPLPIYIPRKSSKY